MNDIELNSFYNSGLIFSYLIQNKNLITVHIEDGTKLSGKLMGWDADYLLLLNENTIQIIPAKKLLRLQAELDRVPIVETITTPDIPKPKIIQTPPEGNDIKDQIMAEKAQISNKDKPPTPDRLDNLVRNW